MLKPNEENKIFLLEERIMYIFSLIKNKFLFNICKYFDYLILFKFINEI